MPAALTYPGVYIEEIPSGVRTIVGVATSITAFLGRAARGPVSEPTTVNSYGDFVRTFGGLDPDYPLGYAVRDFYGNGGSQAVIVRLTGAGAGSAIITADKLRLQAVSPGVWGNNLFAAVDIDGITPDVAERYALMQDQLFNLTVEEVVNGVTVRVEQFRNVAVNGKNGEDAGARRVDRVLAQESNLVRLASDTPIGNLALPKPSDPPPATPATAPATPPAPAGNAAVPALPPLPTPPPLVTSGGHTVLTTGVDPKRNQDRGKDVTTLQAKDYQGDPAQKTGIFALDKADLFNLLCIPPDTRDGDTAAAVYQDAMSYCAARRAMLVVDPPAAWGENKETAAATAREQLSTALHLSGPAARNAALYFPRVLQADPQREGQIDTFAASGLIAGIIARTDGERGVWKAPAGLDAALNGIQGLEVNLNDAENGMLNPLGINCLRAFPINGTVVWGARTLRGADQLADEYKYIPVRRLALYIEESLYRGTQWVVFEPNDEPLWSQIRLNVGAFMQNLFRQGAFQGKSPRDAYFVKCDGETTLQNDINLGIVNVVVGFAPLKPAEFVVIKLQQMAGQIAA